MTFRNPLWHSENAYGKVCSGADNSELRLGHTWWRNVTDSMDVLLTDWKWNWRDVKFYCSEKNLIVYNRSTLNTVNTFMSSSCKYILFDLLVEPKHVLSSFSLSGLMVCKSLWILESICQNEILFLEIWMIYKCKLNFLTKLLIYQYLYSARKKKSVQLHP